MILYSFQVVELINNAAVTSQDKQKVMNLVQVKELIVHKEKDLLDNFLEVSKSK